MCIAIMVLIVGIFYGCCDAQVAKRLPVGELRATLAALPAGDELVALVALTLATAKSPDVCVRLEELASLVQRLCDAKAALGLEGEMVAELVRLLVDVVRTTIEAIEA